MVGVGFWVVGEDASLFVLVYVVLFVYYTSEILVGFCDLCAVSF